MLRESETTPNGLYLIKGKFYGNPILKITFAKGATLNYNPADVTYFPYTRTIEGDFRVKGNHARGTHNRRQAEEVIDIGIITPYRDQAKLISEMLQENGLPAFPVSTVHKFQGRENNVISLTITERSRKVRYAQSSISYTDNMLKKERSSYRPEFPYLNTSPKI